MHDDFFAGTGPGAPSAAFTNVGDVYWGEIVDIRKSQCTVFNTNPPRLENKDDGTPRMQLEITLQTQLRGWAGVSKVPTNEAGQPVHPQEDTGRRRVFVKENTNLQYRLGDALVAAGQGGKRAALEIGSLLSVKLAGTLENGTANPTKQYEVHYKPAQIDHAQGFGGQQPQQQAAPQQQYAPPAQQGPPPDMYSQPVRPQMAPYQGQPPQTPQGPPPPQQQGDPWASQPQAPQQQGDPWANQQVPYGDEPPF